MTVIEVPDEVIKELLEAIDDVFSSKAYYTAAGIGEWLNEEAFDKLRNAKHKLEDTAKRGS